MKKSRNNKKLLVLVASSIIVFFACKKDKVETPDDNKIEKWEIELIDSITGSDVGRYNMITHDIDSGIHVAYTVTQNSTISLKYAYKPYGGNWTTVEVANPISDDIIDIAVDNQKNVFIAYRGYNPLDNNNEYIYMAEKSIAGTFNSVMIDVMEYNNQARYTSIYADNNDIIHIAFERANYGMRYSTYSFQGTFTPAEILDDNISPSNSDIVVDSQGNKHIVHFRNDQVYYSTCGHADNNWTVSHIATGEEGNDSYAGINIAIDRFDNLHIAYRHSSYDNNIHHLYKTAGSNTWQEQGIGNAGGSNRDDRAMDCDTLGNPHILYDENYGLKIASKTSTWSYDYIFGNSDYRCSSNYDIEITDKNRAHVSFHCQTTGVLRYATKRLQ
ncbi:MAG: hypothetical protein GX587_14990 [Bacteroidales bacterium]|nr:hypothetical protein [Bacteroidales bacterium]